MILEIPPAKPEFLKELLEVLGDPISVEFYVRGPSIRSDALRILEESGIKEGRASGCTAVGKCDGETLLKIYEKDYELYQLESKGKFKEIPKEKQYIVIKEISWQKWRKNKYDHITYSIRFNGFTLKGKINGKKEKETLDQIVRILSKHRVENELKII